MRLIRYKSNGRVSAGVVLPNANRVLPLEGLGYNSPLEFIVEGPDAWHKAASALADSGDSHTLPLDSLTLLCPLPNPGKFLCIGLNYRDHAIETKMALPTTPTVFAKFANAIAGPGDTVRIPAITQKPDYEAEFAFVIGTGGRNIPAEKWRDHVFGYTIVNDISARDLQLATSQWLLGKSLDTFGPIGPWIVTADEIPDPHALDIKLEIDGVLLQDSNTRELVFKIPELIAHISAIVPLNPGDIISTGTPAGVGMGFTPPRWLRDGDVMTIEVQGIGKLTNPVKFI